ncbi:hypothetical protein ARMGADRAFT_1048921 [Armillaria gallica]|uniref:Uncharacterized protein n=1 Tax=Armillaria gallica TaxID=47427 RepID=A0A2H3CN86_ARMGA|nr:hypothetical protein ARMGADRAFT_1048921 [Armillaria gallica]
MLSFFVIYMSYHIKPKSVDSYLSGICNQLEHYFPDVRAIRKSLLFNTSTFHDDLLFVAMILTGFYGLLRLAEISLPDSEEVRDWRKLTRRASVEIHDDSYSFWLLAHKADTSFEGNRIIIKCRDTVDPHAPFATYIASWDKLFPIHPLLWVRENGDCPTRGWFIRKLRTVFPDKCIAGQSMRAGGISARHTDMSGLGPSRARFYR